jgi:hypothetical protein
MAVVTTPAPVRVAEGMASLSHAADLGMGLPSDYALTTCVLGLRLGDALSLDSRTSRAASQREAVTPCSMV